MKKIIFAISTIIIALLFGAFEFYGISLVVPDIVDVPSKITSAQKMVGENYQELISKANEMLIEEKFDTKKIVLEDNEYSICLEKEEKTVLFTISSNHNDLFSITYGLNDNKLVLKDINNESVSEILRLCMCSIILILVYIMVIITLYEWLIKRDKCLSDDDCS